MAAKYLAGVVFMVMVLAAGCKKDEPIVEQYEPTSLAGKWHVYAWYNNQLASVENYPNVLDSTIVTISDTGRLGVTSSCTGGSGYYLHTQTGEMSVSNFVHPAFVCGSLADEVQGTIFESLKQVYSFKLENNELTLRSRIANTPFLYLRRLP